MSDPGPILPTWALQQVGSYEAAMPAQPRRKSMTQQRTRFE